jgi:hypothetical protein
VAAVLKEHTKTSSWSGIVESAKSWSDEGAVVEECGIASHRGAQGVRGQVDQVTTSDILDFQGAPNSQI